MTCPEDQPGTLVVRRSHQKSILAFLGCVAFVAIGAWMIGDPDAGRQSALFGPFIGWISVVFFGACGLATAFELLLPSALTLTAEGLVLTHWLKRTEVRWTSISDIFVWEHRGATMAAWRLHADAPERDAMAAINRRFGCDGSVGGGWTLSAEDIVLEMQKRHKGTSERLIA